MAAYRDEVAEVVDAGEQLDLTRVSQLERMGLEVPGDDEADVADRTLAEARNGVPRYASVDIVEHKARSCYSVAR